MDTITAEIFRVLFDQTVTVFAAFVSRVRVEFNLARYTLLTVF